MPSIQDIAVIGGIALVVAWPVISKKAATLIPATRPSAGVEQWRHSWATSLLALISELESDQGYVADKAAAIKLARQLAWQVIGGEDQKVK